MDTENTHFFCTHFFTYSVSKTQINCKLISELFEQLDIERVSFEDKVRLENKFKMLLEYLNMK